MLSEVKRKVKSLKVKPKAQNENRRMDIHGFTHTQVIRSNVCTRTVIILRKVSNEKLFCLSYWCIIFNNYSTIRGEGHEINFM